MSIIHKISRLPVLSKWILNRYSPFKGAGISIDQLKLDHYFIRVKMPLTARNRNVVGTHFGGSLYAMVDPFYMLLLMHHLGPHYIVWDKAASIEFLAPGRGTVYANIQLSQEEIEIIRDLAQDHAPVLREYDLDIVDATGMRIAHVKKTLYIRRKKPRASLHAHVA